MHAKIHWIKIGLTLCAVVFTVLTVRAQTVMEPAVILREGTWDGGVGTFQIPEAFGEIKPDVWPVDGWYRLTIRPDGIESVPVIEPKRQRPSFLNSIITQIERGEVASEPPQSLTPPNTSEPPNQIYLRAPGARLVPGLAATYRFKNGTATLRPKLDYRYELTMGGFPFAFTVQNGLRSKSGAAYSEGAQYTIEYDGKKYQYSLGEFGWDSTITAIADLDGDGKPDFIISVGGNNSGYEAILLSSMAKPGRNAATASLRSMGC